MDRSDKIKGGYTMPYKQRKAAAREKALQYQIYQANNWQSWEDVAHWSVYFYKLARRYGLIKEFRKNGII